MRRTLWLALILLAGAKGDAEGLRITVDAPWATEVRVWRVEPRGTRELHIGMEGEARMVLLPPGAEYLVTVANPERGLRAESILTGRVVGGGKITVRPTPKWLSKLRLSCGPGVVRVDSLLEVDRRMASFGESPAGVDSCVPEDGAAEVLRWRGGRTRLRVVTKDGPWYAEARGWPDDLPFRIETPPVEPVLVTDLEGRPVADAYVELFAEGDVVQGSGSYRAFPIRVGHTDERGRVLIRKEDLPERIVRAAAWGFEPGRATREEKRRVARLTPVERVTIPVKPAPPAGTLSFVQPWARPYHAFATPGGYRVPLTAEKLYWYGTGGLMARTEVAEGAALRPVKPRPLPLRSEPPDDAVRFDLMERSRTDKLLWFALRDRPPGTVLLSSQWAVHATMRGPGLSPVGVWYRHDDRPAEIVLPKLAGIATRVLVTDPEGEPRPWLPVHFAIKTDEAPGPAEPGIARVVANRYPVTGEDGVAETLVPGGSKLWAMVRAPGLPLTRVDLGAGESRTIVVDPPCAILIEGPPGRYGIEAEPKPGTLLGLRGVWGDGTAPNRGEETLEPQDATGRLVIPRLPAGRYVLTREEKRAEVTLKPGETAEVDLR